MEETRRNFIRNAAMGTAGIAVAPMAFTRMNHKAAGKPFVGIQLGTHSLLDEGIEWVLDHMKETGKINTLITYSHSYYGAFNRPDAVLADHGKGIHSYRDRNLPRVWVRHHDKYFKNTLLKHQEPDQDFEFYGRDVLSEMRKPLDEREMKIYIRFFEPRARDGAGRIENYEKVLTVDIDGKKGEWPCWNNPDYREWIYATLRDVYNNYQIDGLQYGAERVGPLSNLLFRGNKPNCFCKYCIEKNVEQGIDPGRARQGFRELEELMRKAAGNKLPMDGLLISVMRTIFKYPELITWENNFVGGGEEINLGIYDTIKRIDPGIEVGRHVDHQQTSWDPIYRAMVPYSRMAVYNDFIKPCLYHDILPIRLRHWYIGRINNLVGGDFQEKTLLDLFYSMMRYPDKAQIPLDEMESSGMPPEYVYKETRRCVEGADGKTKTYAGVGFDVPWHLPEGGIAPRPSDPTTVYESTRKALQAGADGVVASRDYDELQNRNLEAFGRAVEEHFGNNLM